MSSAQAPPATSLGDSAQTLLAGIVAAAKASDPKGLDRLVWGAACLGDRSTLRQLLASGGGTEWIPSEVDKVEGPNRLCSCLCAATRGCHEGVVKDLVEAGADLDAEGTELGSTALCVAAAEANGGEGHEGLVKLLIEAGADVNKPGRHDGSSPLLEAALHGHAGVADLLVKAGADVNKPTTENGVTPLTVASQEGHAEVVDLLVKANADLNKARSDGATPLTMAAHNGHTRVVDLLLRAGADVNKATAESGATALTVASWVGHAGVVEMLVKAGAAVNMATKDECTPLYLAAWQGHEGVVDSLLKAGADMNKAATDDGATPLTVASRKGHVGVVDLLVKAGAGVNHTINNGDTALRIAVRHSRREAALVLVKHGAPVDGGFLGAEGIHRLSNWMAEDMKAQHEVIQEKNAENKQLLEGIPEWCALAAAPLADEEGTEEMPQDNEGASGQGKKRKAPAAGPSQ